MYLKFTFSGHLDEIVGRAFPDVSNDDFFRDYENVYEWVWLSLPELGLCLNISREHEWGKETQVYPIYVQAFQLDKQEFVDSFPLDIAYRIHSNIGTKVQVHRGRMNDEKQDEEPEKVIG